LRFDNFADRLAATWTSAAGRRVKAARTVEYYFAYRSSDAFLARAVERQPGLFEKRS